MTDALKSSPSKRRRITRTQFYTPPAEDPWGTSGKSKDPNAFENAFIRQGKNFQAENLPPYNPTRPTISSANPNSVTTTDDPTQCVEQWNPYRCDDTPSLVNPYLNQCLVSELGEDVPRRLVALLHAAYNPEVAKTRLQESQTQQSNRTSMNQLSLHTTPSSPSPATITPIVTTSYATLYEALTTHGKHFTKLASVLPGNPSIRALIALYYESKYSPEYNAWVAAGSPTPRRTRSQTSTADLSSRANSPPPKTFKASASGKHLRGKRKATKQENDESHDECHLCQKGGDLILCDTCPKVFHYPTCQDADVRLAPLGDWYCPDCMGAWNTTPSAVVKLASPPQRQYLSVASPQPPSRPPRLVERGLAASYPLTVSQSHPTTALDGTHVRPHYRPPLLSACPPLPHGMNPFSQHPMMQRGKVGPASQRGAGLPQMSAKHNHNASGQGVPRRATPLMASKQIPPSLHRPGRMKTVQSAVLRYHPDAASNLNLNLNLNPIRREGRGKGVSHQASSGLVMPLMGKGMLPPSSHSARRPSLSQPSSRPLSATKVIDLSLDEDDDDTMVVTGPQGSYGSPRPYTAAFMSSDMTMPQALKGRAVTENQHGIPETFYLVGFSDGYDRWLSEATVRQTPPVAALFRRLQMKQLSRQKLKEALVRKSPGVTIPLASH